jgi:hypothetical protein
VALQSALARAEAAIAAGNTHDSATALAALTGPLRSALAAVAAYRPAT